MIPKIIHLCWLGNDAYPPLVQRCIDSWHLHMPEYRIMLWDKQAFDIDSVDWVREAYDAQKYAFAADYIRFYALYNHGGIYLDSDVEVFRSFNDLLTRREFLGEETNGDVEAAVMGAEPGLDWVRECMEYYQCRHFKRPDGSLDMRAAPMIVSDVIEHHPDITLLPVDHLSPKNYYTGKIDMTPNTFCLHHYTNTWIGKSLTLKSKIVIHYLVSIIFGREGHKHIFKAFTKIKKRL